MCLGSNSIHFTYNGFRKLNFMDIWITFSLIMLVLINMILWISTKIEAWYKSMFRLIWQVFILLLSLSWLISTKCVSLNNDACVARPTLIDLNPVELAYYPFNTQRIIYLKKYTFQVKQKMRIYLHLSW